MMERLKLQEEVADAALKEADRTIALNASKMDISPLKEAATGDKKERESIPLQQIIDATLQDNTVDQING